jgi:hypothetical protein
LGIETKSGPGGLVLVPVCAPRVDAMGVKVPRVEACDIILYPLKLLRPCLARACFTRPGEVGSNDRKSRGRGEWDCDWGVLGRVINVQDIEAKVGRVDKIPCLHRL